MLGFAVVFPVRPFFGERAFLVSVLIASAIMHFLLELSVARGIVGGIAGGVVVSRWKVAEG